MIRHLPERFLKILRVVGSLDLPGSLQKTGVAFGVGERQGPRDRKCPRPEMPAFAMGARRDILACGILIGAVAEIRRPVRCSGDIDGKGARICDCPGRGGLCNIPMQV